MTNGLTHGFTEDELAKQPTVYRSDLFAGQTVAVSGGGTGIGKAIAWLFARLGAHVVICGRNLPRLEAACGAMAQHGLSAEPIACNIRNTEEVESFFDRIQSRRGSLDILINNAGGQFQQAAIDFSPKGFNAVVDTNLNGTWWMMQAAAKHWRDAARPGSIVNIIAVVERGMPGVAHTCAARAAVAGLTRSVAIEWAPLGIRVNCVAPGAIASHGIATYSNEARSAFFRSNPMMRVGDAFDVAEACVYLAGPSGKYITGETLTVDGGGRLWGQFWAIPEPDYFKQGAT
jgi:citronellol/citronellal dehydrogenase